MTRELDVTAAIRSFGFTPPIGEAEVEAIRSQPDSPERTAILEFVENDIRERMGTPFESGIDFQEAQRRMAQLKADQVDAWKRAIGGVIYERRRLLHRAAWVCWDNDGYGTDDDTDGSAREYLDKFFGWRSSKRQDTSFRRAALERLRLRYPSFVAGIDRAHRIRRAIAHPKTEDDIVYVHGMSAPGFWVEDEGRARKWMTVDDLRSEEQRIIGLLAEIAGLRNQIRADKDLADESR